MKKLLVFAAIAALFASCGLNPSVDRWSVSTVNVKVKNVPGIKLVKVPSSTFTFGKTEPGRMLDGAKDYFQVIQTEFWISKEPIGQEFYSFVYPGKKWPKYGLSYEDVNKMLDKLYEKTGIPFVIASECMYQAAIYADAIHPLSSQETVVLDKWTSDKVPFTLVVDWMKESDSVTAILRKPYSRDVVEVFRRRQANTFYIGIRGAGKDEKELYDLLSFSVPEEHDYFSDKNTLDINGEKLVMIPVNGGEMMLGATDEQDRYAENDEREPHLAVVKDFMISQTEITVGLWEAVMGYVPIGNSHADKGQAVVGVSWYDAMEFVLELRDMTGLPFRLPDEDEWEYAARGGRKSKGYIFSGGNNVADYVVCTVNDVRPKPVKVASKKPNELGLYDMSGNVWEWVRGGYDEFLAVMRGGSRLSHSSACRVSNRQAMDPRFTKDTFGFRVAL